MGPPQQAAIRALRRRNNRQARDAWASIRFEGELALDRGITLFVGEDGSGQSTR